MNGSRANKRPRQERARNLVLRRIDFWVGFPYLDEEVEVDGRLVVPAEKLAQAHSELENLEAKGIK